MNIVFIGPFGLQPKGTISVRALPLAQALVARGHTVTLLIPPWDDPERAGQQWVQAGVQVINVSLPPALPLFFHIRLTLTLVNRALRLHPDVIHFFKPKAYAGLSHLLLWWLRRLGRHTIRLVVDADDWEQAWNERLPYSSAQKRFFAWQERWGLRQADVVTVASRELLRLAGKVRGQRTPPLYLPNGYVERSTPALTAAEVRHRWQLGDAPVVLLYSRFAEFRLSRLVTLVRWVQALLPQARWLIVGQGLQGEHLKLQTLLAQADLLAAVRFAGWVPAAQLPAYFAAADVAIYPYDDTLLNRTKCSVKLIDLLSAGLAVAADAVGQNCAYIRSGHSGLLTPPQDDYALAAAVAHLLQKPALRRRLGAASAQEMAHHFNWATLARYAEEAYC